MCSIGHHDGPVVAERPARRHSDGTAARTVAATPRTELQRRRAAVLESLRASKETKEADDIAEQFDHQQFELLPPDMAQLPKSSLTGRRLPAPEDLYYSAAREA